MHLLGTGRIMQKESSPGALRSAGIVVGIREVAEPNLRHGFAIHAPTTSVPIKTIVDEAIAASST